MKYCPECGAEYLPDRQECFDCQVALVDEPPDLTTPETRPTVQDRAVVYRSGRRIDAELVRSRLEADGMDVRIWSSGLGPWRLEAALTEVTGVPNDFNSHQVVVDPTDLERALEVLGELTPDLGHEEGAVVDRGERTLLASLRKRWILLAFAFFMLLLVILYGPIGT
jgi:hypothetical protein